MVRFVCVLIAIGLLNPGLWAGDSKDAKALAKYDAKIKPADRAALGVSARQASRRCPKSRTGDWVRNPIDAFVLAKLEAKGWRPSPRRRAARLVAARASRSHRLAADARGAGRVPQGPDARSAGRASSRICSHGPPTANAGAGTGSTWCAMRRPAATSATPPSRASGVIAITSSGRSTTTSRTIASSWSNSPATSCPDANADTLIATGFNRLGPWDDEPADPEGGSLRSARRHRQRHVAGLPGH